MKTPKKAASDTVIKTRRGAKADARARTKGKGKSVPVQAYRVLSGVNDGETPLDDIGKNYQDLTGHLDTGRKVTMTPLETDLLVMLLAQVDALFEPADRAWSGTPEQFQAQWQRRHKYLGRYDWPGHGLLPWSNPGEDQAEKKRWSRALTGLEGQGLVRTVGKEVGLTAEGLVAARKLVGHLQLEDALPGLDAILSFIGTDHEWTGGEGSPEAGYVSEASLAGFDPWPKGTVGKTRIPDFWVEDVMVPLAIAGLVEDAFRKDFELPLYCLTESGLALAEERRKTGKADLKAWKKLKDWPRLVGSRTGQSEAAWSAWKTAWEAARTALGHAQPLQKNRVTHPVGDIWPKADQDHD